MLGCSIAPWPQVLCLPAAACREACDLLPGCAGVRILAAHMCELLGSVSSNATFRDQDGSVAAISCDPLQNSANEGGRRV